MTGNNRRDEASAAREERLDQALDRLLSTAPEPEVPGDLAARILAATSRIPQEPVPFPARRRSRPVPARGASWFRPRAVAGTLAAAALFGFAVGWIEPLMRPEAQALDVATVVFGSELEIDL